MKNFNNYRIKSFDKIMAILKLFTAEKLEMDFKEIQESTSLNKTKLHILMANLVEYGFLEHDRPYRRYALGPLLLPLDFTAWHDFQLRDITGPIIKRLAGKTEKTVYFVKRIGTEILYLDRQEGEESLIVRLRIGMTWPLYSTALGKVLTASLEEEELMPLINQI
jgi:DNA-binding IclR family transcriptional regulator